MRPLDSLAAEFGLERVDLLRMNIEGAEKLAIRGMSELVGRVRNIAVSCHDFCFASTGNAFYRSKAEVHAFLVESGFAVTTRAEQSGKPHIGDYLYGTRLAN